MKEKFVVSLLIVTIVPFIMFVIYNFVVINSAKSSVEQQLARLIYSSIIVILIIVSGALFISGELNRELEQIMRQTKSSYQKEIDILQANLNEANTLKEQHNKLQMEYAVLTGSVKEYIAKEEKSRSQLKAMENQLKDIQSQFDKTANQLSEIQKKADKDKLEIDRFKEESTKLTTELTNLKNEQKKSSEDLQKKVDTLKEENSKLTKENAELLKEINKLKDNLKTAATTVKVEKDLVKEIPVKPVVREPVQTPVAPTSVKQVVEKEPEQTKPPVVSADKIVPQQKSEEAKPVPKEITAVLKLPELDIKDQEDDILVVDGDGGVLNVFRNDLYKLGFSVHVARTAKDTIRKLSLSRYAFIILNIALTDMNWQKLTEEIKNADSVYEKRIVYFFDSNQAKDAKEAIVKMNAKYIESSSKIEDFNEAIKEFKKV